MIAIDDQLTATQLRPQLAKLWEIAGPKILEIDRSEATIGGTPVFTVRGKYVAQGWTEWTQGFQFGAPLILFEATDDPTFLNLGRQRTRERMASHITHIGVHDHGFNQVSTYGNLRRLAMGGRFDATDYEREFYDLALRASGAVQAARWSRTRDGDGYIHSFNGPHSLFCDTIRSLRSLALAHHLGHALWGENDLRINLLDRLIQHARSTARYNVYYGTDRDHYDVRGRVAHESVFNVTDGRYRCPSSQQGYSPFTTWTRGLAWIMVGYPEQLEFLATRGDDELTGIDTRESIQQMMLEAARAACDFYIESSPICGVPYWDTGAPGLQHLDGHRQRPADPFNDFEPVDSSAAAIGAQGLLRLGHYLTHQGDLDAGRRYTQAGLTVVRSLLDEPYLATDRQHQGLLLHTIYHRPRGWDHVPAGAKIPRGEACMWGDFHLLEVANYVQQMADGKPAPTFFTPA